ncbi:MAG: S1 RNA-binding domain-containing protein [Lachnospiraceae bacterium]|nr:S1 RNA-binding domain-containing protein [Lachnospiraceae bacterium]
MTESMKDYEDELESSFQTIKEGDILEVTVIGISDTEVTVDFNYYTEGIIPLEECSDDPAFSIKNDLNIGETIQAMVIDSENASGSVIFSMKEAHNLLIWDELQEDFENRRVFSVKITEAVPAGVTGYVKGVRAFIPASQLALEYVEDTENYVGMTVEAIIITVESKEKRLVLSAKSIAKEHAAAEQSEKIGRLTVGDIVTGTIERMESYGVFIDIGDGLMGLCHISQITNKFIKSPKEIVKLGETVSAKIIKLEGDRISLSIKALMEDEVPKENETYEIPEEFQANTDSEGDESPFAKLLKGIEL